MAKVVPSKAVPQVQATALEKGSLSRGFYKLGRVERNIGGSESVVRLSGGPQVTVRSSSPLKAGDRVRVWFPPAPGPAEGNPGEVSGPLGGEAGMRWTAFLPLGFGGRDAAAALEVYVEKKEKSRKPGRGDRAVYFVLTVNTEKQGRIQWSLYLKGRQVALQVFAEREAASPENLRAMVEDLEKALLSRGFVLLSSTVVLKRPFRVPEGFRLNLKA
jgi:hypothetical protein